MLNPELSELTTLFGGIETACKAITNLVKRSQLPSSETLGLEGEVNVQGEDQKKLDVITDEGEKYVAVFDPLDGSSNVDAGIPTGTIIGIYEHDETCEMDENCVGEECTEEEARCLVNTLQPGTQMVAAAYCLYSSSTFFVLTLGNETYGFTLDENLGEFVLSHPNMKIPES